MDTLVTASADGCTRGLRRATRTDRQRESAPLLHLTVPSLPSSDHLTIGHATVGIERFPRNASTPPTRRSSCTPCAVARWMNCRELISAWLKCARRRARQPLHGAGWWYILITSSRALRIGCTGLTPAAAVLRTGSGAASFRC